MISKSKEYPQDLSRRTAFYLKRLEQIDRILELPASTLIDEAGRGGDSFAFRDLISDRPEVRERDLTSDTQALCVATLQKLYRLRRRLAFLDDNPFLKTAPDKIKKWLRKLGKRHYRDSAQFLTNPVFGGLNPLTASYVFRMLLEAGEAHAHGGLGFLAFFGLIWPFYRRFPDGFTSGARLEPWQPTAYVTARCLLPIFKVQIVTTKRADLLNSILFSLDVLKDNLKNQDEYSRWEFTSCLDNMWANLLRLSRITSISWSKLKKDWVRYVKPGSLDSNSNLNDVYAGVRKVLARALTNIDRNSKAAVAQCEGAFKGIRTSLCRFLTQKGLVAAIDKNTPLESIDGDLSTFLKQVSFTESIDLQKMSAADLSRNELQLTFAQEYLFEPRYWEDYFKAAAKALGFCGRLLDALKSENATGSDVTGVIDREPDEITNALKRLADGNTTIANYLRDEPALKDAARWTRTVMDRETAHAGAKNMTDFDPSELVNAIAVAARSHLISTPLQVSDAVAKALHGAREDGSWQLGHPFFSRDNVQAVWPGTSETVWSLISAIQRSPDVGTADKALFHYVDWLERTRVTLKKTEKGGWPSDRLPTSQTIHIPSTAFSINALLEIRDLVEHRLWQLCQQRFTAVFPEKGLNEIDPVDLGLAHSERLHCRLARMATDTQESEFAKADYSLVLHGPPGSSKTKLAEAISIAMWKDTARWGDPNHRRFIRITPADFTRMGEGRLDSEARLIFELLTHIRAVTIFFDEIDDVLRIRNTGNRPPTFMELVVPAMLNRLADLRNACPRQEICFLLATNYIENIEPALLRRGRIDRRLPVVYPDEASRRAMFQKHLRKLGVQLKRAKRADRITGALELYGDPSVKETNGLPWIAVEEYLTKLREAVIKTGLNVQKLKLELSRLRAKGEKVPRLSYFRRFKIHGYECPEFRTEMAAVCRSRGTIDTREALGFDAETINEETASPQKNGMIESYEILQGLLEIPKQRRHSNHRGDQILKGDPAPKHG